MIDTKIEKPSPKLIIKEPGKIYEKDFTHGGSYYGGYRSTPVESTPPQPSTKLSPEEPEDPDDNPPKNPAGAGALTVPVIPEEELKPVDAYFRKRAA